ncbi:DDB1- and CUL4-associated factor 1-like [Mytilus galloprovincialis]|uniref:DDB1- and CUL4-associated factor 1-like n=1 Tax=Mytilus galloprovincialis TaxID=29158 RepID=UPI003F7CC4E4
MAALDSLTKFNGILDEWITNEYRNRLDNNEIINMLTKLSDIIERETEEFYKMDPDPFDDRHPGRSNPTCTLGHLMKALFKNDNFMNKLVNSYLLGGHHNLELQTAACRLLLDVLPGLEVGIVFVETEGIIRPLLAWAEKAEEPLRSYATGLLAGAMEVQDVAVDYKDENHHLVLVLLKRLHELKSQMEKENQEKMKQIERPFGQFSGKSRGSASPGRSGLVPTSSSEQFSARVNSVQISPNKSTDNGVEGDSSLPSPTKRNIGSNSPRSQQIYDLDTEISGSSWTNQQPYVIGTYSMSPLTLSMKQRLILQYLTPLAEYQELLSTAFEKNSLDLIFYYVDLKKNTDGRLALEALKYLATLLCHKKFSVEFLQTNGVQKLLDVYRPSIAATGVSLCLYYLSYFEDAMERVCLFPEHILSKIVNYILWLLECSHNSSRSHAAMFLGQAFTFRVILDLFDKKDGLRRLVNVISTLEIMNENDEQVHNTLNDDQIYTMRQMVRHTTFAMKRYFEAHLSLKADEIRRSHLRNDGGSPVQETPAYKPIKVSGEVVQDNIELMMDLMPVRLHWDPELLFHKLGGVVLLTKLLALIPSWSNYTGKSETVKNTLDIFTVCTVTPKTQLALLQSITVPENLVYPAISIFINLADGETLAEPEVQKSALNVLINCVCGPIERYGAGVGRYMSVGSRKKINSKMGEDILSKMWNGIRINNGIMVLLKLLSIKTPITDADSIRALACKALLGLSRSETVRQIISKLPLFTNGQIQYLMKEPVLQDKQQEFIKFCRYASDLMERVSGKLASANFDASLDEIRRADIVAHTKIRYSEKELLQLIHDHLQKNGLMDTACMLQKEGNLPRCTTPPMIHPASPQLYMNPQATPSRMPRQFNAMSSSSSHAISSSSAPSLPLTSASSQSTTPCTPGPIRFTRQSQGSPTNTPKNTYSKSRFLRERDSVFSCSPAMRSKNFTLKLQGSDHDMTLDKIVTEYLRKQHALCRNPVSTCPSMSLFNPHRCPEPRGSKFASINITSRLASRAILPPHGGLDGACANRKFIYSRFRPVRTYKDADENGFSSCAFSVDQQYLLLGTHSGDVKCLNVYTGDEVASNQCHSNTVTNLQPSKDGNLLLTSFAMSWTDISSASSLWSIGDGTSLTERYALNGHHAEFSKLVEDKILTTEGEKSYIIDVPTGDTIVELYDADKVNGYRDNRATFHPSDDLVLNDGVLWDVRSGKSIHKFDKFNPHISGSFHPMGLEIIINSEIWDIRTFHLLHTAPALDQCQIKFSNAGDIIYAIHIDEENDMYENSKSPYSSTLRTFDSTNYSSITTFETKAQSICDICTENTDSCIAMVEQNQQFGETSMDEFVCKLYEIGKLKDSEDDQQAEEEEEMDDNDDDDDGVNLDDDELDSFDENDGDEIDNEDDNDDDGDDNDDDDDDDDDDASDIEFSVAGTSEEDDGDLDEDLLFQLY